MREIFLTKGIGNEKDLDGYIDEKVSEIKSVPKGEPFRMLITSYGGDTAQGDRIDRAVREHDGETEAMIIGAAASMAMNILPAFDKRYSDPEAELMIHKARYIDHLTGEAIAFEKLSEDQQESIRRNSAKMYERYSSIGVDEAFLSKVYLSDGMEDYYLTPKEAEKLGILEVKPIESESEIKLAASLSNKTLKSEFNKMGIFKKESPEVLQVVDLENGGKVAFTSVDNKIKKGVVLSAVGTSDGLGSEVFIKGGLKASLNATGAVVAVEEVDTPKSVVSDEAFEALLVRVSDIETAISAIQEAIEQAEESEEGSKMEEEEKNKAESDKIEAIQKAANDVLEAAATITSSAKLSKIEDRNESYFSGLSPEQQHIAALNKIAKGIK